MIEQVKNSSQVEKSAGNTEGTGVSVNNQDVLRDDKGRFLKGTKCANPSGRPKDTGFKQRLNELVGSDSRELALLLTEIAFYDQSTTRDKWPKYKTADKIKALETLLEDGRYPGWDHTLSDHHRN